MKISALGLGISLCIMNTIGVSAQLCAEISRETAWDGGVFSVIKEDGTTIATTPFTYTGGVGCTDSFSPGTYLIRFTGANLGGKTLSDDLYGCMTAPYQFNDTILHIVFNQGLPPFNGNAFCNPRA